MTDFGLGWGVPLVLLVVVPVYVWAEVRSGGQFFRVFLWHHNVARGLGGSEVLRAHPWWFYGPCFLAAFLPWSPALAVALWRCARRGWWREDAEARFGLAWLLAVGLFLSLMRFKRADYLLPAFPGAALFLGCAAERAYREASQKRLLATAFALALALCAAAWALYLRYDLDAREPAREYARFAAEVRRLSPRPRPVLIFRTEAHALAFHVGRPLSVFVEWENLDAWASRPEETYVVMPAHVAPEWPRHLTSGRLEEVMRNTDLPGAADHEKPLVLLRTRPGTGSSSP